MDIRPPFVADRKPLEMLEPGEGPFHHPAVFAQLLHGLDSPSSDPGKHSSDPAGNTATPEIVGLISMQFGEPARWSPSAMAYPGYSVNQLLEGDRVMLIRGPDQHGHRDAVGIGDQVMLGSVLSTVGWVRTDRFAPPSASALVPAEAQRCVPRVQRAGFLGPSKYTMHLKGMVQGVLLQLLSRRR